MAVQAQTESKEPRFALLEASPFRVGETSRRERWWFSGPTLNSGARPNVVGFVWTQWLLDRGVAREGAVFDEEYAHELYRNARRHADQPEEEDDTGGAWLWAAAEVLEERELVQASYRCADITEVIRALLERGPIVTGLDWRSSMDRPQELGGRMVCRVEESSPITGGHAVLLNGVSLDLELEGIRGFIRFKNSWGSEWGEHGQVLIPIEDLADALMRDTLLPIPVRGTLGPGGRQEVAIAESGPELVRYEQEAIGSDIWTTRDGVGYAPYADAIARAIQHPDTRPPLTIGIKAPWGAGKTSLMRMIRERLEWPLRDGAPEGTPLRPLRLEAPATDLHASLTNRLLLRRLRLGRVAMTQIDATPQREEAELPAVAEDERRWRPTVWFNPWMHQTGEQVWAGLARAVIDQTTSRMDPLEREHFWLELNLRRIDEQAVRRKVYGLIVDRVLPAALGLSALFVVGLLLLAFDSLSWLGASVAAASPLALAAVAVAQGRSVLGTRIGGSLSQLVGPEGGIARAVGGELAGTVDELLQTPRYEQRSGFLYLVQTDMERVLELVAKPERPLVIFVDDLDRCSPPTVVQVIEALNLFLAGEFKNTVFVVAMEPDMVAAHIEAAYADLVTTVRARSGQDGESVDLGWRFLEKFVQLPLTLPGIEPDRTKTFVGSLFAAPSPVEAEDETSEVRPATEAAIQEAEERIDQAGVSLGDAIGSVGAPASSATPAEAEALRRIVDKRLSRDNPEIQTIVAYAAQHLEPPNPREIKRFVNVFRFLVMIHTERTLAALPTAASLEQLAKLALVSTRWPALMGALSEETVPGGGATVFELLERPPVKNPRRGESRQKAMQRGLKEALKKHGFGEATMERLLAEELRGFLAADPVVGAEARDYL